MRSRAAQVEQFLPGHIAAVQSSGHPVAWICDPMHGKCVSSPCPLPTLPPSYSPAPHPHSTLTSASGLKTRHFGTIISELTACLRTHAAAGSRLDGVSLEFTGELSDDGFSVTECLGGSMGLSEGELGLRYQVRRVSPNNGGMGGG